MNGYNNDEIVDMLRKKLLDLRTQQFYNSKRDDSETKKIVALKIENEMKKTKRAICQRLLEIKEE